MTRLEKLQALEPIVFESILATPEDKRAPLIAQYRAIVMEIAELGGDATGTVERNGLLDFQAALADRKPTAPSSRRASR